MYNLFVSGNETAWVSEEYTLPRSRFLEYTKESIVNDMEKLNTEQIIEILKNFPCLFIYEKGTNINDAYLGKITSLIFENNHVVIRYQKLVEINYNDIQSLSKELDIGDYEWYRTHWAIKNIDLHKVLSKNIVGLSNLGGKKKNKTIPKAPTDRAQIMSFSTFYRDVINQEVEDDYEVFYRGHSNYNYKLVPSLFRKDDKGNYMYLYNEDIMFKEVILENPEEFLKDHTCVEKLVRMQHYLLPTRLLDITSNPLVGLYFASMNSNEKIGEVIVFKVKKELIKYYDSDTVSCIANLAKLDKVEKEQINIFLEGEAFNEQRTIKKLVHFIKEEKAYFENKIFPNDLNKVICVKSKKSNSRIVSQSGSFLLFGLDSILSESGDDGIKISRYRIANKDKILTELEKMYINNSVIFPGIESSMRHIREKYRCSF